VTFCSFWPFVQPPPAKSTIRSTPGSTRIHRFPVQKWPVGCAGAAFTPGGASRGPTDTPIDRMAGGGHVAIPFFGLETNPQSFLFFFISMNKTHSAAAFRSNQRRKLIYGLAHSFFILALVSAAFADNNRLSLTPALGWSSWSFIRNQPNEIKIEAQALALHKKLQSHGFQYINLDDYWYLNPSQTVDKYGRWVVDSSKFPHGIAAVADYIHSLGLRFGLYVTPGIPVAAYNQNTPIEYTRYYAQDIADTTRFETNYNYGDSVMYYIDYSKPGAQEFINSWAPPVRLLGRRLSENRCRR